MVPRKNQGFAASLTSDDVEFTQGNSYRSSDRSSDWPKRLPFVRGQSVIIEV